jgi:hypothetical protein
MILRVSLATALTLKWEESERAGEEVETNIIPYPSKILQAPEATAKLWAQPRYSYTPLACLLII